MNIICLTFSLILHVCSKSAQSFDVTPNLNINLYRGVNSNGHWASSLTLPAGFTIESNFTILNSPDFDTTLYFECTENGLNNFVSKDPKCEGKIVLSLLGYIYNNPVGKFKTALYRCLVPNGTPFIPNDHFISTKVKCEQKRLINEGLLGFVSVNDKKESKESKANNNSKEKDD